MVQIKVLLAAVVAVGVALYRAEAASQLASTTALHIPEASSVHHGKLELHFTVGNLFSMWETEGNKDKII